VRASKSLAVDSLDTRNLRNEIWFVFLFLFGLGLSLLLESLLDGMVPERDSGRGVGEVSDYHVFDVLDILIAGHCVFWKVM